MNRKLCISPEVLSQEVNGGTVLLDLEAYDWRIPLAQYMEQLILVPLIVHIWVYFHESYQFF